MIERYKRPDRKNAMSILEAAKGEMNYTLSLDVKESAGPTIVRNIYEAFRMLGDAILVSKGIISQDHLLPLQELSKLKISTPRPINLIETLRILRHNVNYYGYKPKLTEVEDVIDFAKSVFNEASEEVRKQIESKQNA
ncbi:MAG: hypothetical protein KKD18_07035 [Nanoarchaeota archaeon]|nr:hypothetical protein [Nanoarchaeota archaeon]MBU0978146.1 hypothetical protein [Nanoarchaeota archaeon]